MAYSNGIKRVHDTPLWIPQSQTRGLSTFTAGFAPMNGRTARFLYYYSAGIFSKYDTWQDSFIRLQGTTPAPILRSSFKYSPDLGSYGNCLGATSTTITTPAYHGSQVVGMEIEIIGGTGAGQTRTITAIGETVIHDSGTVSGAASTSTITDTTKRWKINELVGMQLRTVGVTTNVQQVKRILYNTETVITIQDSNFSKIEPWNNGIFSAVTPYVTPIATAGAASIYFIEKNTLTVNSAWTVTPDSSSSYVIKSGGVFFLTNTNNAPYCNLQYYDCLLDTWTQKTAMGGMQNAILTLDFDTALNERSLRTYETGTATSGGARTLTNSGASMTIDFYKNYELVITGGTGVGQRQRIVANSATYFEVQRPWDTQPDNTSTYKVFADSNALWFHGNSSSSLLKYLINEDSWVSGTEIDFGTVRNITAQFSGQEAFGITSGVRSTSGITVLNATPTAGGTGYNVGDVFNITTGGSAGKGKVTATAAGVVTAVELYATGTGYTTGAGKGTSNVLGTGTGLTVDITTIGTVARINVAISHNLIVGDVVTFAGCTDATWNANYTVLATDASTFFDVATTAAANMVASNSQSTTVIVDSDKNWAVNEHVGKIVKLDTAGNSPTTQLRRITSNTATTLTVATIVTGVNGGSTYTIMSPDAFGKEKLFKIASQDSEGIPTGGSTTTLADSTKAWLNNQWAGYRIRITAGTGVGNEYAITSNNATTLVYGAQSFTPDSTTRYEIMATYGVATAGSTTTLTDTTKNWPTNIFSGKRLIYTAGTGQRIEVTITSNTATVLTFGAITAPDTTTNYTILAVMPRLTACGLLWPHTYGTDTTKHGRYLISPKGSQNTTFDFYNISKDAWDLSVPMSPMSDVMAGGSAASAYEYDGIDSVYFTISTSSDFYTIQKLNLITKEVTSLSQTPFTEPSSHVGQIFTLCTSIDGGLFGYLAVRNSRLMYKALMR